MLRYWFLNPLLYLDTGVSVASVNSGLNSFSDFGCSMFELCLNILILVLQLLNDTLNNLLDALRRATIALLPPEFQNFEFLAFPPFITIRFHLHKLTFIRLKWVVAVDCDLPVIPALLCLALTIVVWMYLKHEQKVQRREAELLRLQQMYDE